MINFPTPTGRSAESGACDNNTLRRRYLVGSIWERRTKPEQSFKAGAAKSGVKSGLEESDLHDSLHAKRSNESIRCAILEGR